ncbi:MAG TPA: DUF5110 domain-containing protein [Mollicutes bacterium]|nr:DUF5110 domain-containing protein [Mollicutes bacterium]
MYKLGEQFKINYDNAVANEKSIFQGKKYRITILTDRLVRFEYNDEGVFEDRPTALVWNRKFNVPQFEVKEDSKFLEITTKYFKISYVKEKNYSGGRLNATSNLKVELLNSDRFWYYGHPEVRNLGAPKQQLVNKRGKYEFGRALYSTEGFASIDDSESKIISENGVFIDRPSQTIDTYVFMYLNDYQLCLQDYYELTGYPALIPRYALGNWWSRNESYNDETLKDLIDQFDYQEIPISIVLLNEEWHLNSYDKKKNLKTGFTFNKENFKEPYDMISYLHSKGIRIGLNINPLQGIYPYEEYYENAKKYLEPDEAGIIPFNALDPRFIDVYLKMMIHPLDAIDVDFYWIDINNDINKFNNFVLNHYHFYDMKRSYKRRPMILSNNARVASHRYPVLYSGKTLVDWETLKLIPFFNGSASNIGVAWWSHDIGGYHKGIEDNELYIRFVQIGVFSPILKFGSQKGKYYKREPWRWNIKTYNIVKDYLTLRHRLIPYLYSEAYKYHKYGSFIIEPIYYRYKEVYDDLLYRNQYYLGSEFFISPILTKKNHVMNRVIHKFYIPDGVWFDFVTGKKFPGGRSYVSFFRDQDYPVFVKAGSIIPLSNEENLFDTTPPKNMEIQIFPGRSNTYQLYEDDGMSDLYNKGFFIKTNIDYNYLPNNHTVIVRATEGKSGIIPKFRNYKIKFRNTKQPEEVITFVNDVQVKNRHYTEGPDFVVEVDNVTTIGQLTVNCKGKDIEIDAIRLINDDIEGIISDLTIETEMKERIDAVIFSDLSIKKKRISIRKLRKKGLDQKFIKLFLKLLEYIEQV